MSSSAAKPELRPGSLIAGKFKLQKQLGRGAAGVVWSAVNVATSRQVALKLLLRPEPKARERLLREAKAAGALKHPNIVDVYDVIVADDGSPALVLEFLEGQTLQQLLTERAPLPPIEAAAIGRDVARGLSIAHASGIVHRDLKPANIFLHAPGDETPVVKVVDFGISKNLLKGEATLTETGMAVGSPSFMSPEQVRGERQLDGRTDLWALGVIMYEMLTGKRLFDGRAHEVLTFVLSQPIPLLDEQIPGIDRELNRVVMGLLERDMKKRIQSADEVAERLATVTRQQGERIHSRTEPPPPTTRRLVGEMAVPGPAPLPRPGAATKAPVTVPRAGAATSKAPAAGASKAPPSTSRAPTAGVKVPPAGGAKTATGAAQKASPTGVVKTSAQPVKTPTAAVKVPVAAEAKAPATAAKIQPEPPPPPRAPTQSVPKIHQDDEEDEPTHVAPMAMRRLLAQQQKVAAAAAAAAAVPSVYKDDEDEDDRTRVAADAELTAAVLASREPPSSAPVTVAEPRVNKSNENAVATVRPPPGEMTSEEIAILAENAMGTPAAPDAEDEEAEEEGEEAYEGEPEEFAGEEESSEEDAGEEEASGEETGEEGTAYASEEEAGEEGASEEGAGEGETPEPPSLSELLASGALGPTVPVEEEAGTRPSGPQDLAADGEGSKAPATTNQKIVWIVAVIVLVLVIVAVVLFVKRT